MPTIFRFDGYRVIIYSDDHRPPHVHVFGRGCEAVFLIAASGTPSVLRENLGFSRAEIARIRQALDANTMLLLSAWEEIHG